MGLLESIILAAATAIFGVLAYIIKKMWDRNQVLTEQLRIEKDKKESAIEAGLACVLRNGLMDAHEKYMKKGYITVHGKESWDKMHNSYHDLGGNGLIEDFDEDIQELQIKRT